MTTTTAAAPTLTEAFRGLAEAVKQWRSRHAWVTLPNADGRFVEQVLPIAGTVGPVRVTESCSPTLVRALPGVLARLGTVPPCIIHQAPIDDPRSQRRFQETKGAQVIARTYLHGAPVVVIHRDIREERLASTLVHELQHVLNPRLHEREIQSLTHLTDGSHARAGSRCWCGMPAAPLGRGS